MRYLLYSLIAFFLVTHLYAGSHGQLQISGNASKGDTVQIFLSDNYLGEHEHPTLKKRRAVQYCANDEYHFKFDSIKGPVYFSLTVNSGRKNFRMREYLAMSGDSLFIHQNSDRSLYFTGRGSETLTCLYRMDSVYGKFAYRTTKDSALQRGKRLLYLQSEFRKIDSIRMARYAVLNENRPLLNKLAYQIMEANLVGRQSLLQIAAYRQALLSIPVTMNKDSAANARKEVNLFFTANASLPKIKIPGQVLSFSKWYVYAGASFALTEAKIYPRKPGYQLIIEQYQGVLRDKLLAAFVLDYGDTIQSIDSVMKSLLNIIKDPLCKQSVNALLSEYLRVHNVTGYDFILEDVSGKKRKLSEFRGKKVFIDYWYTGCLGCLQFYTDVLGEVEKMFEKDTSIIFMTISTDKDRNVWQNSISENKYTSRSILNLYTGNPGYEHPAIIKYGITGYPTVVVIDEKGKVFYNDSPPRNKEDLIRIINSK